MMVNQAILYGVGDFFFWGGNLAVANPVDFCEMLVPSNRFFHISRSQYGDPRATRRGGA